MKRFRLCQIGSCSAIGEEWRALKADSERRVLPFQRPPLAMHAASSAQPLAEPWKLFDGDSPERHGVSLYYIMSFSIFVESSSPGNSMSNPLHLIPNFSIFIKLVTNS